MLVTSKSSIRNPWLFYGEEEEYQWNSWNWHKYYYQFFFALYEFLYCALHVFFKEWPHPPDLYVVFVYSPGYLPLFFFMELTQILISIFLYYMSFYMVHCTQISISLCILHATYHCICKGKRKYTYIKKKTKNVFPQFFIVVCKKSVLILIKDFNIW